MSQPDLAAPSRPRTETAAEAGTGIHVKNLVKTYGASRAVDDVSFDVPHGSFCTLLGASGSGKSTILRMMAGLDRPDGGEISIAGRQMSGPDVFVPPEKRAVGFVFQAYALWPHMKVFDQVAYPLQLRHWAKPRIRESVEKLSATLGLEKLLQRYPSELSGGQQQRVALARALVVEPTVLLLDEPLSNLDAALRHQMRRELEEIHQRVDVTTVYVTHDQEEAMAVSDMVVLLDHGEVIETGAPREIYEKPRRAYTAGFVGSSIVLRGTLVKDGVQLPDGTVVQGTGAPTGGPGAPGAAAIKPVDVEIASKAGANTIAATVTGSTFLGPAVELRVQAAGTEILIPVGRHHRVSPGETVQLRLRPEHVVIVDA